MYMPSYSGVLIVIFINSFLKGEHTKQHIALYLTICVNLASCMVRLGRSLQHIDKENYNVSKTVLT